MSPKKARYICMTRGPAYSDETVAERERLAFEARRNLNPGVLVAFLCEWCGKWHLGTRITKLIGVNVRTPAPRSRRLKDRIRYSVGRMHEAGEL